MKELNAPDKIVQQMSRDGAVQVNKATGGAERISAREPDVTPANGGNEVIGKVTGRVLSERRAFKKWAVRKENMKIFKRGQRRNETPRLQFTDAERGDPAIAKYIKKSDKATGRYETARARIPKEKVLSVERVPREPGKSPPQPGCVDTTKYHISLSQRVSDMPTGKTGTRLVFRERDKPPNGKLTHALDRAKREAANAFHSEVRKYESDNTGVEAAHFAEKRAEGAARMAGKAHGYIKSRPYRAAEKAEEKAFKSGVKAQYKRDLRMNPEFAGANPVKKMLHKRKIKKEYAKAFRQGDLDRVKQTAATAKNVAVKTKEAAQKAVKFVAGNGIWFLLIGGGLFFIMILMSGISSCAAMFGGGGTAVIGTSYTAEDEDILGAEADYAALESGLSARIANISSDYPGYDEYRVSADEIGHDPFVLASYLTAKYNCYTRDEVQAELQSLFSQQYALTLTPVTEVRYREETRTGSYTDADGNTEYYTYTVEVPYNYYILYVTLTNRGLETVALANLTPEQADMYAVYMETKGNKPELFDGNPYASRNAPIIYDVPPEALTDTVFAAMLQEAEKYIGYAYVWGGSTPETSFDCSGYVSWIVNHSGWNVGRLTASGLFNICTPVSPADARPGDLVFFWHTYDAPDPNGPTHVGLYVGGGYMLAAGNPIGYADITTPYWVSHFYSFGRLPPQ